MIPKIIEGRRDKESSFKQLISYMTDKPSDSLTDTVQPTNETVSAVAPGTFDGLNNYLTRRETVTSEPVEVAPGVNRVKVGDVTCQYNTFSLEGAAAEMNAVSLQNHRAKDPVMHYVLSWPEHEKPDDNAVFDSVKFTLASMGMQDNQYVAAIHRDTDNLHVHVAVNRVHPETYKAASSSFTKDTLHQACRVLEMKHGWSHTAGAYVVNDRQQIVRNPNSHKERGNWRSKDAIHKMENKDGTETLYRFIVGDKDQEGSRQNLLHISSGLREAKSWQDVHDTFNQIGLRFQRATGQRGFVVTHQAGQQVSAVKASLVFNKAQYTLKDIEDRLGKYVPSATAPAPVALSGNSYQPGGYRRDAAKRAKRRAERAEERLLLKGRYKAYRSNLPRYQVDREFMAEQFRMINSHTRMVKNNIRQSIADPHMRRLAYNLAEFKKQQAIAVMRLENREKRDGFKAANPALSYREWVEQEALKGDKAALSQMRGFAYSARRKESYKTQLVADIGFGRMYNGVTSHDRDDVPVKASAKHNVTPRLLKDGTVIFHRDGVPVVADRGHIILTESAAGCDSRDTDLAVALSLAGNAQQIRFDGSGEFKEAGIKRIADAAVNHQHPVASGITFTQSAQAEYARAEQERLLRERNDSKNEMEMKNRINGQFKPR
ncbi:TraI/MobA(P) family conjugative relaxase [Enterobacter hormaechei]|uniref:TraI/MobA(P) family conjugative relaxase n=1 Tax=Enterobacter hormaechei TaxID=158836 RepID=UPI002181F255|nr:TraI/MobA(P) family conjugative relaxase [Enterobacter hormaechei]